MAQVYPAPRNVTHKRSGVDEAIPQPDISLNHPRMVQWADMAGPSGGRSAFTRVQPDHWQLPTDYDPYLEQTPEEQRRWAMEYTTHGVHPPDPDPYASQLT